MPDGVTVPLRQPPQRIMRVGATRVPRLRWPEHLARVVVGDLPLALVRRGAVQLQRERGGELAAVPDGEAARVGLHAAARDAVLEPQLALAAHHGQAGDAHARAEGERQRRARSGDGRGGGDAIAILQDTSQAARSAGYGPLDSIHLMKLPSLRSSLQTNNFRVYTKREEK